MKFLAFLLFLLFVGAKSMQAQPLIFYGIDLNSDWYTLTNISRFDYDMYNMQNPESKMISVAPHKELSITEFNSMGIEEILLGFPTGARDLNLLKPDICLGRHRYSSESDFNSNAYRDFNALLEKFKKTYGQPSDNVAGSLATSVKWAFSNQHIFISIDRGDKLISIGCIPQR